MAGQRVGETQVTNQAGLLNLSRRSREVGVVRKKEGEKMPGEKGTWEKN